MATNRTGPVAPLPDALLRWEPSDDPVLTLGARKPVRPRSESRTAPFGPAGSSCALPRQALTLDNLDRERVLLACAECAVELDLWAEGRWEPTAPANEEIHGYHLPRLYSPWGFRQISGLDAVA